jgi:hypothetical protein
MIKVIQKKKRFLVVCVYCRFLSIIANITPTKTTVTIMAAAAAAMYISVGGKVVTGYGDDVDGAESTAKLVSEEDGQ